MISIVVPIYNAQSTIKRCIESLLNQTYKDIEIVLIDDGSKDNSGNICQQFCEVDCRVKYYRKENGGVASARNYGIKLSNGEYIMFVDSDDFIVPETVEVLHNTLIEKSVDLVICGFEVISLKAKRVITFGECVYAGYDEIRDMLIEKYARRILNTCWGKLYKKDLLINEMSSYFPIGEDLIFNVSNLERFKSIATVDKGLYIYDCTNISLTRSNYKMNKEIIDTQYKTIENVFWGLFASNKLMKIVYKDYLHSIIDCFYHQRYTFFSMHKKLEELLKQYDDKIEQIEPDSLLDRYLSEREYRKISLLLFKKRIITDFKNIIKTFIKK